MNGTVCSFEKGLRYFFAGDTVVYLNTNFLMLFFLADESSTIVNITSLRYLNERVQNHFYASIYGTRFLLVFIFSF